MTARRLFSQAEDAYILAHYSTTTLVEMAWHLGRRYQTVQQRVEILIQRGLLDRQQRYYSRPWTPEEDDWLSDHWGTMSDAVVARHLRRSIDACKVRTVRAVKVCRKMAFWTARNVADLFGVDSHLVIKWIRAGCLRGRRSSVRCGDGNIMWAIADEAIQEFIGCYPWHYDRTRIERGSWWRKLADGVWAKDPWLTTDEAAAALGVNPETVRRHIRRGWLRSERTWEAGRSGGFRVPRSALTSFRLHQVPRMVSPALQAWYERAERPAVGE